MSSREVVHQSTRHSRNKDMNPAIIKNTTSFCALRQHLRAKNVECQENSGKSDSRHSPRKAMVSPSADCGVASSFAEVEHLSLALI
jgi:hypothetical protein